MNLHFNSGNMEGLCNEGRSAGDVAAFMEGDSYQTVDEY